MAEEAGYRFVNHTADALAECTAPTFPDLLLAASSAFYALACGGARTGGDVKRAVTLSCPSREEALVRWLQELIFLLETERFVAAQADFAISESGGITLHAHMTGYACAPGDIEVEVKAATYHGLSVAEADGQWSARVVFDL